MKKWSEERKKKKKNKLTCKTKEIKRKNDEKERKKII